MQYLLDTFLDYQQRRIPYLVLLDEIMTTLGQINGYFHENTKSINMEVMDRILKGASGVFVLDANLDRKTM